jgi:hypothetical protein
MQLRYPLRRMDPQPMEKSESYIKMLDKLKFVAGIFGLLSIPFVLFQLVILPLKLLAGLKLIGMGKAMLLGMLLNQALSSKHSKDLGNGFPSFAAPLIAPFGFASLPSVSFNLTATTATTAATTAATTTATTTTKTTTTTTFPTDFKN